MAPRLDLQALLEAIPGVAAVYFQPPTNVKLVYPCIVYRRDSSRTDFADNVPQRRIIRYQVTVMDPNPDSAIPQQVADMPMCQYERFFTADNLNHDIFNLFF